MKRRDFISLLGTTAALFSTRSHAQQPSKTFLIGYLAIVEVPYVIKAFKDGLRRLGYIEGQNLRSSTGSFQPERRRLIQLLPSC
jgi:hypothetical protein